MLSLCLQTFQVTSCSLVQAFSSFCMLPKFFTLCALRTKRNTESFRGMRKMALSLPSEGEYIELCHPSG